MSLEDKIEEAINKTLVVVNKESIKTFCVPQIVSVIMEKEPGIKFDEETMWFNYFNSKNKISTKEENL